MIERNAHIAELYDLKHRKDNDPNIHFDYENNFIQKVMPEYTRRNTKVYQFTRRLGQMMVLGIEAQLVLRNFYNYTVGRYYSGHSN